MKIKVTVAVLLASIGILATLLLLPERSQVLEASDTVAVNHLSERLRTAADGEEFIVGSIADNLPSLVGSRPEDLDQKLQDLLASLARKQGTIRNEIADFTVDLTEHVSKSQDNRAEQVLRAIETSDIEAELAKIQEHIEKNHI